MISNYWSQLALPTDENQATWETFHENSKVCPLELILSDEEARAWTSASREALSFDEFPCISLPDPTDLPGPSLSEILRSRCSSRKFGAGKLSRAQVANLLYYSYGATAPERDAGERHMRVVPSAGGLYPYDLFVHCTQVDELDPGLYHYHPIKHELRLMKQGAATAALERAMIQPELAEAPLVVFLVAQFLRTTFKYGDRGYRYVLFEAGHIAQNLQLTATALDLGSVCLGGYFDRKIDEYLELDGVTQSALYLAAVGPRDSCRRS